MTNKNELETRRSLLSDKQRELLEQWKLGRGRKQPRIVPRPEEDGLVLSPAQKRLWFMDQMLADKSAYNMYFAVRFSGELDIEAARRALQHIIDRHESLRINFINSGGRPQLRRMDRFTLELPIEDVSGLHETEAEAQANAVIQRVISSPFDLERGLLMRAQVIRLKEREHMLAICLHHIISDGWSMGVLAKEWVACYRSYSEGKTPALAPLPIQYSDFAHWQTEQLKSGAWEKHLRYWKDRLEHCPSIALAPDKKMTDWAGNRGGEVPFELPDDLAHALKSFCAEADATMFMTLLALFGGVLYRYTHERTLVVGTPVANRNDTEIEGLIGYFVNLLPLRMDIGEDMTFRELLRQVAATAAEAYDHQDFPFDRIVEELQPDRQGWAIPLVRNLFVYQNTPAVDIQLPKARAESIRLFNGTSKSDVLLSMAELQGKITGRLEYNANLFVPQSMQNFVNHFIQFIRSALSAPDRAIGRLDLMEEGERERMLQRSAAIEATAAASEGIHRQFERNAALYPNNVALKWNEAVWTYRELNAYANRLARHLLQSGAEPGQFIGLCMYRSPYLIAGILAILKAGCAYVPLDPAYPEERIRWMLSDSGCALLLVDEETRDVVAFRSCTRINAAALPEDPSSDSASDLSVVVNESDLAYMIYTSGSTGKPKGVLVEHGSVNRLFAATRRLFGFHAEDVWTLYHSCAFDFSVWEIWGALLHGGSLVIVPAGVTRSFEDFYRLLARERVTVLNQTPSAFKQLIHVEQHAGFEEAGELSLRYIIFGGEALELQSLRPWFRLHGDRRPQLINMYGITEITVHATFRPITLEDLDAGAGSVIGAPLPDLEAYILDEHGQPVPLGVPGELYIGGRGVARGYWNREELTRERFIANPFASVSACGPRARLYRSGDLARWTAAGEIEYLGRRDEQVKVRGYRIELGEIESAVSDHELVSQSVVVAERNEHGDAQLTCYVIPHKNELHAHGTLRQFKGELVERWETVFDSYYAKGNEHEDKTFHIVGWNDTYTGLPIPAVEMEEWTSETVERILKYRPKRVLEIGCGTGLLLFRIAPSCESYIGTDLSENAIEYVSSHLHLLGENRHKVSLFKCNAHELPDVDQVDMVILNSVVQYFPDVSYLNEVLQHVAGKLKPGGCIFLGDICGLMFREAFHCSVVLNGVDERISLPEFNRLVLRKMKQHSELMLDTGYFAQLQRELTSIRTVEVLYKKGNYRNEMNKFRYDAVLHVGDKPVWETEALFEWSPDIKRQLREGKLCAAHSSACFLVTGIPNGRLAEEWEFMRWRRQAAPADTIADYRRHFMRESPLSQWTDPADILQWGGQSHHVELLLSDDETCLDAIFMPYGEEKLTPCRYTGAPKASLELASIPMQQEVEGRLAASIREELKQRLPDFMIPSQFVVLEQFPLTANGKIERAKLRELKPGRHLADKETALDGAQHFTDTELALREMWLGLLDAEHIGLEDSFFDMGGHSLLISRMMFQIRKKFQVQIPLVQLMQEPTIKSIASQIERVLAQEEAGDGLDLASRIVLDPAIQAADIPQAVSMAEDEAVLLTGGTGFFGAFLLHELLHSDSSRHVYCLVRAADRETGMRRIAEGMRKYGLWKDEYETRVTAVTGDLGAARLGLDEKAYEFLTKEITSIFHNGAVVNFAQPYLALEAVNVKGCEEILRFAAAGAVKPIHYISTLYVFSEKDAKIKKIILEDDVPVCSDALKLGYTQSKWVAEGVMREGRRRGIPVSMYRLGRISGDSRTGACQDSDFFWKIIRFCLQLGAFPDIDFRFNLIPADFAADIIVRLASSRFSNQTFHVMNDHDCSFKDITRILAKRGYSFAYLPWMDWKARVSQSLEAGNDAGNAGGLDISIVPFIEEMSISEGETPVFNADKVFSFLKERKLDCPQMDADRLAMYIDYFAASGYFEPISV
ncbi:non-ribosomal peptide synthetase [Paenibacillus dendritiformis]|uniref:non-ribosomal peptide synthetase n=1 Tax=Paenibacillus dendritiformis TaxID=130049 RepID=UPI001BCB2064|nr:non-ribosomal peptide synthetase [Paenibacillus dendritiformis]